MNINEILFDLNLITKIPYKSPRSQYIRLYWTHRHHCEGSVDDASSDGGIDRLLHSSVPKDAGRVVEDLKKYKKHSEFHRLSWQRWQVSFLVWNGLWMFKWGWSTSESLLTALIPDSCWESCRTRAITSGWRYRGERSSSGMVTFFSLIICRLSSFISCMSALTSEVPLSFFSTKMCRERRSKCCKIQYYNIKKTADTASQMQISMKLEASL